MLNLFDTNSSFAGGSNEHRVARTRGFLKMTALTRINTFLLTLATAAFALTALPAGYAADVPDPTQKTETAADRLRQETELRNALKADPNNAEAHLQLGRVYLDKGNWTAAAAEARAARSNGTRNDEADALLAWALYLQGKYDVLFRQVEPGQREAKAESVVRMSLGLAHLSEFEFDNAAPLLRDAVRLDPDGLLSRAYRSCPSFDLAAKTARGA